MTARSTELSSTARTCGVAPTPPPPAPAAAPTTAPPTTTLAIPTSLSRRTHCSSERDRSTRARRRCDSARARRAAYIHASPRGAACWLPTCYGRGTEAIGQEIPVRLCGERIREIFDTAGPRSSESPIRGGAHVPRVRAGARPVTAGRSSLAG